jgi:hypothetical protein
MWARIHLIPALQAEEDRDQVRRYLADKAREKELLGSETRVYNSDRCVPGLGHYLIIWLTLLPSGSFDQPSQSPLRTRRNRRASCRRSNSLWICTYSSGERISKARPAMVCRKQKECNVIDFAHIVSTRDVPYDQSYAEVTYSRMLC